MIFENNWRVAGRSVDIAYGVLQSHSKSLLICHAARLQWEAHANGNRFIDVARVASKYEGLKMVADLIEDGWLELKTTKRKGKEVEMIRLTFESKRMIFSEYKNP